MLKLIDKYLLQGYASRSREDQFQARILIMIHFCMILLMAMVFFMGYLDYNMIFPVVGIMVVSMISVLALTRGHLASVTVFSYAAIGLFATLLVFSRNSYNNYEVYMLGFIHMFILVVSSLLTYQVRYTLFNTVMGIFYLIALLLLRGIPLSTSENTLDIDDYIIAGSLLLMAGFIINSTVQRRKTLLQTAKNETSRSEQYARKLEQSLAEKEILLHEVHHRVKNNLNVAMSLQRMQIRNLPPENEAVAALDESIGRLNSMALVHERLYAAGNLKAVEFKPYIVAISDAVVRSFKKPNIRFVVNVEDGFSIELTRAVPCGLILNELITNICKHAFPHDEPGDAEITFTMSTSNMVTLIVSDAGVGIPDQDWTASNSLGMHLINLLTEQLAGTISIDGSAGTTVIISFPLAE